MVQMLYFWHRRVSWVEVFFEAGGVIPLSLWSFYVGAVDLSSDLAPVNATDALGCFLFFFGTYVNLYPEYTRHVWKLDKANAGKLYMQGLWMYARRINYTGEILSFAGYGLATGPAWCVTNLWVSAVMAVAMGGFSVMEIEYYLERRYKDQWAGYVAAVPYKMIPGVW
jgi:steroid 5-alpha reductase family enzyme